MLSFAQVVIIAVFCAAALSKLGDRTSLSHSMATLPIIRSFEVLKKAAVAALIVWEACLVAAMLWTPELGLVLAGCTLAAFTLFIFHEYGPPGRMAVSCACLPGKSSMPLWSLYARNVSLIGLAAAGVLFPALVSGETQMLFLLSAIGIAVVAQLTRIASSLRIPTEV